jgi:SAM-dependent methyltransferase
VASPRDGGARSALIGVAEVPAADRLDFFQVFASWAWVPMVCGSEYRADYWGEFRASGLGAVRVVVLDIMPITVRRTPELISQADPDMLKLLLVCGKGCSVVEQDGRQAQLSASDFAIYNTRRPYEVICGAAEIVGPTGSVVGIERDPAAVELARRRTKAASVEFRVGDVQTLEGIEGGFDAVVGRLILMFLPDPAAALRRAATLVRPGGLVCLHEADLQYLCASPRTPLWDQAHAWFLTALEKSGIERRMGPSLFTAFRAAGLPEPHLLVETFAAGGPDAPAWGWANVIAAAVPLMEQTGVATRAEVAPETLASRLQAETLACNGCVIGPLMTGAWATLPAA